MVTLTDSAVSTLQRVLANSAAARGLRIQVADGGCAGLKYQMGLEAGAGDDDTVLEYGDVKVFIDAGSMAHMNGVVVDYVESVGGAGFKFENPNATSTCGCGSSFSTSSSTPSSCGSNAGGGHGEGGGSCGHGPGHHH